MAKKTANPNPLFELRSKLALIKSKHNKALILLAGEVGKKIKDPPDNFTKRELEKFLEQVTKMSDREDPEIHSLNQGPIYRIHAAK